MAFHSYKGVPDGVLNKHHITSSGENYSLKHNEKLKVEMTFLGKGASSANSQGWERDPKKYFKALYQNHPEMFSKKNVIRINNGHSPIVDQKMIDHNPSWSQYRNQALIHHHIGGDGEAVAIPQNAHVGSGEIHNIEKDAGITDRCKEFSQKCAKDPNAIGKTVSQLSNRVAQEQKSGNTTQTASPSNVKTVPQKTVGTVNAKNAPTQTGNAPIQRSEAVRDATSAKPPVSSVSRTDSVKNASSSLRSSSSAERSNAVRSAASNTGNSSGLSANPGNGQQGNASADGASHSNSNGSGQRK